MLAWIDENGNGRWDSGEPPVENVQFQVNDTYNGYRDVGGKALSDWNGQARLRLAAGLPNRAL